VVGGSRLLAEGWGPRAGGKRLVAGGWWLVAGGWWLVAGGWWLVESHRWLKANGKRHSPRPPMAHTQKPAARAKIANEPA
jgi:hypothetical protein